MEGGCGGIDALHSIELQLRRGGLDPIGAKQAYYQYYLAHPGEDAGAYQPLHPTEEFTGIISTGYVQAQAELGAANLGGLALGAATTNGVIFEAMSGYGGNAALAAGMTALSGGFLIYKKGPDSDMNLTPRPGKDTDIKGGLSFFDSPTNPNMQIQKGEKYLAVDATKLNELQVINDNDPPGHFTVRPESQGVLLEWAATRGTGTVHRLTEELRRAIQFIDKWR